MAFENVEDFDSAAYDDLETNEEYGIPDVQVASNENLFSGNSETLSGEFDIKGADESTAKPEMPVFAQIDADNEDSMQVRSLPSSSDETLVAATNDGQQLNWYASIDGTYYAYGADGSYYEMMYDGSIAQIDPYGYKYLYMTDGTVYVWDAYGNPVETAPDSGTADDYYSDSDSYYGDSNYNGYGDSGEQSSVSDDGVYGSGYAWTTNWFYQEVNGYCGPTSVAILVNEYFNTNINNPEYMVSIAYDLGLTNDISQGMYPEDILKLLQANGVASEMLSSSMSDLASRLESGFGVIAIVDSGELWGDQADRMFEDNASDHALVVTEINMNTGMVTLADPGNPQGNGMQVAYEVFEDAWADSGYNMISTTVSDPDLVESSAVNAVATGDTRETPNLALVNLSGRGPIR